MLVTKPHPLLKISEILLNLEGFMFATPLDHKKEYYDIPLTEET